MSFDPGKALFRVAHEPSPGVLPLPASAGWIDYKVLKHKGGNKGKTIDNKEITGNSQGSRSLKGKFETQSDEDVNVNVERNALFYANAQRGCDTTNPTAGVFVHRLAPSGTDPVAETIAKIVNRDDGNPEVFRGGKVKQLKFSWKKEGLFEVSVQTLFERADYWGSAVVVADPSASAPPQIRGLLSHANWTATDGDLFVKLTGIANIAATPPTVTCKAKRSAAATYGAVEFEAPIGADADGRAKWGEILDSNGTNGANFGVKANAPEVHFPTNTGLAVNDEWRFDRERDVWTPAFADVLNFSEVYAEIQIDGEHVCVDGFDLTVDLPVEAKTCLGGFFADEIRTRGERVVKLSIDKEYVDVAHRKRLETGTPFLFQFEAYTGLQFVAGWEHSLVGVLPLVEPEGENADVDDPKTMKEKIEGTAKPDATNPDGFVDDFTLTLTNSIADIATAA